MANFPADLLTRSVRKADADSPHLFQDYRMPDASISRHGMQEVRMSKGPILL
jgi:hypothetical protein